MVQSRRFIRTRVVGLSAVRVVLPVSSCRVLVTPSETCVSEAEQRLRCGRRTALVDRIARHYGALRPSRRPKTHCQNGRPS